MRFWKDVLGCSGAHVFLVVVHATFPRTSLPIFIGNQVFPFKRVKTLRWTLSGPSNHVHLREIDVHTGFHCASHFESQNAKEYPSKDTHRKTFFTVLPVKP